MKKNFEYFMAALLLGIVPGAFVSACTCCFLYINEQERKEIDCKYKPDDAFRDSDLKYKILREEERTSHDRLVGLRTAGLVALAALSFFLSLRFAPSSVSADSFTYRAYTICSAGSILAGLIWPPYNYYIL